MSESIVCLISDMVSNYCPKGFGFGHGDQLAPLDVVLTECGRVPRSGLQGFFRQWLAPRSVEKLAFAHPVRFSQRFNHCGNFGKSVLYIPIGQHFEHTG